MEPVKLKVMVNAGYDHIAPLPQMHRPVCPMTAAPISSAKLKIPLATLLPAVMHLMATYTRKASH